MCCTKCIIYKNITDGCQILRECLSVLSFLCTVTCVLKKNNLTIEGLKPPVNDVDELDEEEEE